MASTEQGPRARADSQELAESTERREFLKRAAGAAATAPAVALLLSASATPAAAQDPYAPNQGGCGG